MAFSDPLTTAELAFREQCGHQTKAYRQWAELMRQKWSARRELELAKLQQHKVTRRKR